MWSRASSASIPRPLPRCVRAFWRRRAFVICICLRQFLPLLGWLFKREETIKEKTELLIFLTPHIAMNAAELEKISEEEKKGVKLMPEAVEEGVYDEHIRGMKRGGNFKRPETDRVLDEEPAEGSDKPDAKPDDE